MRTRQRLHGVEHGGEVVRVIADKATASGLGRGKGQGGLGDGRSDRRMPRLIEACPDETLGAKWGLIIGPEEFDPIRPHRVKPGLGSAMALLRPVTEADQPPGRMTQVETGLVDGASGEGGERGVRTCNHRLPVEERSVVVQHLTGDGCGKVAVRLLDEQRGAELGRVSPVGEVVLIVALALELTGIAVEMPSLAEQVEADVGERHVLFELGGVGEPLGQPVSAAQADTGARP